MGFLGLQGSCRRSCWENSGSRVNEEQGPGTAGVWCVHECNGEVQGHASGPAVSLPWVPEINYYGDGRAGSPQDTYGVRELTEGEEGRGTEGSVHRHSLELRWRNLADPCLLHIRWGKCSSPSLGGNLVHKCLLLHDEEIPFPPSRFRKTMHFSRGLTVAYPWFLFVCLVIYLFFTF